jgi:hypothetical protein
MINAVAWSTLENMWNYRGRMRKKLGYSLVGRLRRCLTAQSLSNTLASATYDNGGATIITTLSLEASAQIQSGSITLTFDSGGGNETILDDTPEDGTLNVTATNNLNAVSGTINYNTGAISVTFAAPIAGGISVEIDFCYFPNLPVMGLRTREREPNNNEQTIAFDTVYAYRFTSGAWEELPAVTPTTWSGSNSQFFYTTNFENPGNTRLFWAVNFDGTNNTDPIRYYDGTDWTSFAPNLNASGSRTLSDASIILPYKERLMGFLTREIDTAVPTIYPQRIRWSELGNILDTTNGWRDDIQGRGGFLDIPTAEKIVAVGFIRERVIIECERSTWELVYTGNENDPFYVRKINTESGAESKFSVVQFDDSVMTVGNIGIHSCNGDSVRRFDDIIPSFVFDIHNGNSGIERVYGIRDYYNEIVMWTYPDNVNDPVYPNRMLIYNYRDNNWAMWKDCFTCFGYFQRQTDRTWADLAGTTWAEADFSWVSGQGQSLFRNIVAGNQNGYVVSFFEEQTNVVPTRYLTGASKTGDQVTLTIPNHCFEVGDYISTVNALNTNNAAFDPLGNDATEIAANGQTVQQIADIVDSNNVLVVVGDTSAFPFAYAMLGEVTHYDNFDMRTKFFTPFWKQGSAMQLNHIDFLFDTTAAGEAVYNIYVDDDDITVTNDPDLPGQLGSNVVRTRPDDLDLNGSVKKTIWHRGYGFADGQTVQIQFTMNDEQMKDRTINQSQFTFYAMLLWAKRVDDLV